MHQSLAVAFGRPMRLLIFCWFISSSAGAQSYELLYNRADSLFEKGKYSDALIKAQQALLQAETESGKQGISYAGSLNQIGVIVLSKGEPIKAEPLLVEAKGRWEDLNRKHTNEYVNTLRNLGTVYRTLNQYDKGITVLNEALFIQSQLSGKTSAAYSTILNSIGSLYLVSGDIFKAEPVLQEAYKINNTINNKEASSISVLNNLGTLYQKMEDYIRAEPYLEKAVDLRKELLGTEHPLYGISLGNLLLLYQQMGNYQKAIDLGWQLVKQRERILPLTQLHAYALNNLAENYRLAGKYNEQPIDTLYIKALSIIGQKIGTSHSDYAGIQNNLALLYVQQEKYESAARLYQHILKNVGARLGSFHPDYTAYIHNLGKVYTQLNQFSIADSLLKTSLNVTSQTLGSNTERYISFLGRYAQSKILQKQHEEAVDSLLVSERKLENLLTKNFLNWSEGQRNDYITIWNTEFATYFSEASQLKQSDKANKLAYQTALFLKGSLLNEYIKQTQYFNTISVPQLRETYNSLLGVKSRITNEYNLPLTQRRNLDSLEAQAERLEKELARQSAPFRQAQQAARTGWQDVQKTLKSTDAAVEFIHFQYHNGYKQTDSVLYIALVLRPGWKSPRLVPLTYEKKLAALLRQSNKPPFSVSLGMLRSRFNRLTNTGQLAQGEQLYQLIWQPIDSLLRGVRQVWISPSGLLHKVSLAALPYPAKNADASGQYLSERYALRQVGSTRTVAIASAVPARKKRTALLYGGVDYSTVPNDTIDKGWPDLPGTKQEVMSIGTIIGSSATVVTGQTATKAYLRTHTATPPDILHLATHGFFRGGANQRTDFIQTKTDPVLTQSGVVMAVSSTQPVSETAPPDNGILTGLEFANLNLSGTELVVLSACETGLGDIRGSEGVFGIQRAVKMAGAKNLLISLWPVPDGPTSQFMTVFYKNWYSQQSLSEAFAKTQQAFRRRYPPAVWAAFVLIE